MTVGKTRRAITSLIQYAPKAAWVNGTVRKSSPIEDVQPREVVIVKTRWSEFL